MDYYASLCIVTIARSRFLAAAYHIFGSRLKIQPNKILISCDLQSAMTSWFVKKCKVIKIEVMRVVSVKSN